MTVDRNRLISSISALIGLTLASPLAAQDLEPRAYAASPIGLSFLFVGAGRSSGGVIVDPSLPVADVEAALDSATLGVGTTFSLFGRSALVVAAAPYVWGDVSGRVGEVAARVTRSGLADPRMKLSVNLLGGRALAPVEFAKARPATIVGVSLSVIPPLGQYDPHHLINLGANRWAFKPEVGVSHVFHGWTVEAYAGTWLFTTNETFFPGASVREQRPMFTMQAHASYTIRPRLWLAADSTWFTGGSTIVDGVVDADFQRNSRIGGTLSLPVTTTQSIKFTYSRGATTRIGGDFSTVAVAWQLSWLRAEQPRR
jgi:hypothetical protein